ncbi:MAG: hypothetical protein COB37_07915 [Kordiimonadales bacterium]|nr:MAG: hypothetical protein COB37_07915 [Kordiimonadales bacterium]
MVSNPRIFHLLHLSHKALFRAADKSLVSRFGITAAQHGALMYVGENEGSPMSAMARALGLRAAAASTLVDRMEKKGLMERKTDPQDGRAFALHLKPQGRGILNETGSLIPQLNAALLEGYTTEERRLFAGFFKNIIERANEFEATELTQPTAENTVTATELAD